MKQVIIIGAGPAGLTAGLELLRKSNEYQVTILDASTSLGGLAKTVTYHGNRMDLGGHRFFTKNKQVQAIWDSLLPTQPTKDVMPAQDVFLKRERLSHILYMQKLFSYPVSFSFHTFYQLGLKKTIKIGGSYIKSLLHQVEENSLADFYQNRFGKELYQTFFKDYTKKVWGKDPTEIDASWGKQRIKGVSITKMLLDKFHSTKETSLIREFYYPNYGPGSLWNQMANEIYKRGGKICFEEQVTKIEQRYQKITTVTTKKGHTYQADILISSMPIKDLFLAFQFPVPTKIKKVACSLPYRDFITIGVLVNKKATADLGTINIHQLKDTWIYVQEKDVQMGRIQIFNNWSPALVKNPQNTTWLGLEYFTREEEFLWNLSDQELKSLGISELEKIGLIQKRDVLDSCVVKVKKAYPAYFDSYHQLGVVKDYLNQFCNLYLIGRNGQHRYNNMDHSMLSAVYAIDCILDSTLDKNRIWQVNTEEEYHEEISKNN